MTIEKKKNDLFDNYMSDINTYGCPIAPEFYFFFFKQ